MTTIITNLPSTAAMRAVLGRTVTPYSLAQSANCQMMAVMRDDLVTETTGVSEIVNLADEANQFTQATEANRASMVDDANIGDALSFGSDYGDWYRVDGLADYSSAFSMAAVFSLAEVGRLMTILGAESSDDEDRAGLRAQTNSKLRARVGDGTAQSTRSLTADTWYAALMSFDGTDTVTLQLVGEDAVTGTSTVSATTTYLQLSDEQTAFGLSGKMKLAALWNVDIFDGSQSALLADINTMLRQQYGSLINGIS